MIICKYNSYIEYVQAKEILFREVDINNVSVFICWDIWDQETACTPTLKCPELNFNFSIVYRIPDLFCFFNYVFSELVIFHVLVHCDDGTSYSVASGKLSIKDILDYPQNKLHYVAPMHSVFPCSVGMNFGQLSLWVRLSCDVEHVETFKKKLNLPMHPDPGSPMPPSQSPPMRTSLSPVYQSPTKIHTTPPLQLQNDFTFDNTGDAMFKNMSSYISTSNGSQHQDRHYEHPFTDDGPLTVMKESGSEFHLTSSPRQAVTKKEIITLDDEKGDSRTEQDDV
ncbi:uncharacterized protein LOC143260806 [Megalopta genalis]|uniref:uncharacterized protein LOC143260806 n=1 Tax=Megalopta genalis TaxID=115081 RepID=UPI003FD5FC34